MYCISTMNKNTYIFFYLLLTILCALGMSSCVSRMHQVAYEYPRTYEGAGLESNSVTTESDAGNMKLTKRLYVYECDGQWYLPVSRICYTKKVLQGEPDTAQAISDSQCFS